LNVENRKPVIHRYQNGKLTLEQGETVQEFALLLQVNGRQIATLVSSPHDLRQLVVGFLRLQGFVQSIADFDLLAICDDFGVANVRIKGELPDQLRPVLTSGCGTGITFTLPEAPTGMICPAGQPTEAATIFSLMDQLNQLTDRYSTHGGIHSAAAGDEQGLLLHCEDIGRHNTVDRIAGEALLRGIDLSGKLLLTSGRISSEMAAKAAQLGVRLLASRTSPTDMAATICQQAGITLVGYVRGGSFKVYSRPEGIITPIG
jgi:FdhD protein